METFCGSKFWDSNSTWYTDNPNFTPCFQKIFSTWIPCAFSWIFLPLEVYHLGQSDKRDIPFHQFNIIKLILILAAACLKITDIVHDVIFKNFEPAVYFYSNILLFITLDLFFFLTFFNIKRGIRSSGILFTFSFLSVICGIPEMLEIIKNIYNENDLKNISYTLYYISMCTIFLLNCFADEKPKRLLCLKHTNVYPYEEASFLSKLFVTWFDPYVWKNYKKPLENYLWELDSKDCTENNFIRKEKQQNGFNAKKTRIIGQLMKQYGFKFWLCTLLRTIYEVMAVGWYVICDWLLSCLQTKDFTWKAYFYTALFFVLILSQIFLLNKYSEICYRLDIRVRGAVVSTLYKKALSISNAVRKEYTSSDIVNLISVDTFLLQNSMKQFHFLFGMSVQIVISYVYLWTLLGRSFITSAVVMIIIFVAVYHTAVLMKKLQINETKNKDIRGKFMQEIFTGIKVLKMYVWELSFKKVALHLRTDENKTLRKIAIVNSILHNIFLNSPFLLCLVAYASYVLMNSNTIMDIRITFVSFVVFNSFRVAFHHVPLIMLLLQQVLISINRIDKFLNSEELDDSIVSHELKSERLIMENASFAWISKEGPAELKNLNIRIYDSTLVGIVGSVGAGKSSMISAFLGEMYKMSGYVNTRGTIAYVPQQAWILNTTIKENITFTEHVDQEWYEKVIEACALKPDFQSFADSDWTEIGEKGVNLSGGQKQRISLARAVYQNADIYFFDDPLSAVDSKVANHLFQHVLGLNGILKKKTRILVTHNTKFFPLMDQIIVLKNGHISEKGTYQELLSNNSDFSDFIHSNLDSGTEKKEDIENEDSSPEKVPKNIPLKHSELVQKPTSILKEKKTITEKLIEKEHINSKRISKKTIWIYFSEGGIVINIAAILLYAVFQTLVIISNIWLCKWITSSDGYTDRYYYLLIYTLFGIVQAVISVLGGTSFFLNSLRAGMRLYNKLLDNVLQWPMSTFDATPIGRIITRFSDDVYVLDNVTGPTISSAFAVVFRYLSILILTIIIIPISTVVIVVLIIVFFVIREYHVGLSQQLKRIESLHKSPLYSHLIETVSGIQSIRAYGFQTMFIARCYKKNDLYSAAYHSSAICTRWFCSRTELLEIFFLCSICVIVILKRDQLDMGIMGLQIAFAVQIIRGITYMAQVLNEVEDCAISVERIHEYLEYPRELSWDVSSVQVTHTWPDTGKIQFDCYKLRYREGLDYVLKGLTFTIKSGEKIGIVGRTGAGKTSIILALFRIVEPAQGTIFIDGVDITKLGLHKLRSKLTVIPQDPILFSGTLRFNLDPLEEHSDENLWNILEKSHLTNLVRGLPKGLHHNIEEGGRNLSFGQRQLICLARALLRKTKILVLDEATASVDVQTDQLIQQTIREQFSDCTVITIAHRLNTLQDYDKILILDGGRMGNFDSVKNLLLTENSQYRSMVLDSSLE